MSEAKEIQWSHSRVEQYRKCERMFNEYSLLKTVPFVQSEPQLYGDRVHKMLDKRLKGEADLPVEEQHLEPLIASIERAPGITYSEQKMTINSQLQPSGWFSKDAWCRIIIDVMKLNDTKMFMGDWKTGKPTFDEHQLKLFAAVGFIFFPSVEEITTAYIWLKTKTLDPKTYKRTDTPVMWAELLQVPTQMQASLNRGEWREKPGRHCKWCGVNKQGRCRVAAEPYRGD